MARWYDFAQAHSVSRETIAAFERFEALLVKWQSKINLVGASTLHEFWDRHVLDSAQLWAMQKSAHHWVDVGTGAGFPGLVIARLSDPAHVTLIEASTKRCAFLREAARALNLTDRVTILNMKIENVELKALKPQVDVFTARAFTGLTHLLTFALPIAESGTVLLFPKGSDRAAELATARETWSFDVAETVSLSDPSAAVLEIRHLRRAVSGSSLAARG